MIAKKIMIVEDEMLIRNLMTNALTDEGYEVVQVADSPKCLSVAIQEKPSLIIMDINMPQMNGIDAIKLLKSHHLTANIPVLVLTAFASHENILKVIQAGAIDVTTKTQISLDEILSRINRVFSQIEAVKGLEAAIKAVKQENVAKKKVSDVDIPKQEPVINKPVATKIAVETDFEHKESIENKKEHIDRKLKSVFDVKSLPFVAQRINQIANDSGTDTAQLVTEIKKDPLLAAKILKLANSAFYASTESIISLERAVLTIGRRGIGELASSVAVFDQFLEPKNKGDLDRVKFWGHCFCCGSYAKRIGRLLNHKEPELLFLSGLFHSIGIAVFDDFFHEEFSEVINKFNQFGGKLKAWEEKVLGYDHVYVGGKVMNNWGLVSEIVNPTLLYGNSFDAVSKMSVGAKVLKLANILAETHGYSIGIDNSIYFIPMDFLNGMNINPANLEIMYSFVENDMQDLKMVFYSFDTSKAQKYYEAGKTNAFEDLNIDLFREITFAFDPVELTLKNKKAHVDVYDYFDMSTYLSESNVNGTIIEIASTSYFDDVMSQLSSVEKVWKSRKPFLLLVAESILEYSKNKIPQIPGISVMYEPFSPEKILALISK